MASYLQLEQTAGGAADSGAPIVFDRVVLSGGDSISYNGTTGDIVIHTPGFYAVDWFVAPEFGRTTNGGNYALVLSGSSLEVTGSSHERVSPTVGFAVIEAAAPDTAIRLINTSDNRIILSRVVYAKAALSIHAIAVYAEASA